MRRKGAEVTGNDGAAAEVPAEPPAGAGGEAVDLGLLPGLLGYALRRAQMAVFQDFMIACAAYDIRPAQFAVLEVIGRNPGLKQARVGAALGIQRTNFVPLFDELERRGLARREPVPTDRRSYALHLTEDGRALMARLKHAIEAHDARLTACIGEEAREDFLAKLHRLAALGGPQAEE
jgi:DNA-binding MarR family transcriptional regulator